MPRVAMAARHAMKRMRWEDEQYSQRCPNPSSSDSEDASLMPHVLPVEEVPLFDGGYIIPVKDRRVYSVTTESALAKNICSILRDRGWKSIPSEYWFSTKNGEEMFRPKDGHGCEFCDRAVFSHVESRFELSECLFSKSKLATMLRDHNLSHLATQTFIIKGHEWRYGMRPPPEQMKSDRQLWFLKREDKDYGTGITVCKLGDAMSIVKKAPTHYEYILQAHVPKPLLTAKGEKFSVRIYALLFSFACSRKVSCWIYTGGYISSSPVPWSSTSTNSEVQITTDRTADVKLWELPWYSKAWPGLKRSTGDILKAAAKEIASSSKRTFELFGFDFMLTKDLRPYCLEVNSGPVTKDMDLPMLRQLVGFALVAGTEAEQLHAARKGVCSRDPRHWEKIGEDTPARFALADEVPVDDTPFKPKNSFDASSGDGH